MRRFSWPKALLEFLYLGVMFRKALQVFLNPFFQALVVAGLFILFVPLGLRKYRAEQLDMTSHFDKSQFIFADLDHDGLSERIHTFINESGNAGVVIRTNLGPDQQRNYRGIYEDRTARLIIGDCNGDNLDEIFLFTYLEDTVFLHAVRFAREPELFIKDRFISTVGKNLNDPDLTFIPGKVTDMTGDGLGDVVFGINAGFSRYPRNVFIYDVARDSFRISPRSGAFFNQLCLANLDDDPFEEITLYTAGTDNFNEEPMVYHDSSSWMMALDHDLSFLFTPVMFSGTTGNFITFPIFPAGQDPVLLCIHKGFRNSAPESKAMICNTRGEIVKVKDLDGDEPLNTMEILPRSVQGYPSDEAIGFMYNNGLFEIDSSLNVRRLARIQFSGLAPDFIDIDRDGKDEFILPSADHKKHLIFRSDFSHPAELDYPIQAVRPVLSVKLNGDEPPQLSVMGDTQWWLFGYGINPIYRYRIFIYLAIYLSFLGFILLIRKLYSFQLRKKYETEKKITALQLSGIKAQMEPHFIFNVINSIGSSIYREKKDEAYEMVVRFSQMVRTLLSTSDQLYRTLNEELEFVTNFLELEKRRFPELFEYRIDIDPATDRELLVPKMILQLHTENALKHGLRPKGMGGLLEVTISQADDYLVLSVKDNGIGRKAAAEVMGSSTGKGMKMLSQLFETYNKHNPKPILQKITDLADESGGPAGTMVSIRVPVEFNPEIY